MNDRSKHNTKDRQNTKEQQHKTIKIHNKHTQTEHTYSRKTKTHR